MTEKHEAKEKRIENQKIDKKTYDYIVNKYFLIPTSWVNESFNNDFSEDQILSIPELYQDIARSFKKNIDAAITTVCVPFQMTLNAVLQRKWQAIHMAESIRALDPEKVVRGEDGNSTQQKKIASKKAQKEYQNYIRSNMNVIFVQVVYEMNNALKRHDVMTSASEILRQGVVLIWSSLEVFIRDFFLLLLNSRASLIQKLINANYFSNQTFPRNITIERLVEFNYDLRAKMGDIVLAQSDVSSFQTINKLFKAIFPQEMNLQEALRDNNIWFLIQRRNLIAHKRGIIDKKYLESTGDQQSLGAQLEVYSSELRLYITSVIKLAKRALESVNSLELS